MNPAVGQVPVAPEVAEALPGAQYSSAFTLQTPLTGTPEQWARALFERCPALWRAVLRVGWRFGLGLRLGPRHDADHVEGWTILDADEQAITLAASSPLITARAVFVVDGDTVTWATLVRHRHWLGGMLWSLAAPVHHRTVPYLFTHASP